MRVLLVTWLGLGLGVACAAEVQEARQPPASADPVATPSQTTSSSALGAAISRANADIVARYAPGSITSVALADSAIGAVGAQRAQVEAQYLRDRMACNSAFFMTNCLDAAHEQHRISLAQLRPVEIEAQAFKRRERVAVRDRALAEKKDKTEQTDLNAAATAAQPVPTSTAPQHPAAGAAHKAATPHSPRIPHAMSAPHLAKPLTPRIDAATEAGNISSYDRKVAESLQRQRQLAEQKAEKERARQKKQADAGAKSAADAKSGSAPTMPAPLPKPAS